VHDGATKFDRLFILTQERYALLEDLSRTASTAGAKLIRRGDRKVTMLANDEEAANLNNPAEE
jgi:hypothetical protein